jgi:hypothetical protein
MSKTGYVEIASRLVTVARICFSMVIMDGMSLTWREEIGPIFCYKTGLSGLRGMGVAQGLL